MGVNEFGMSVYINSTPQRDGEKRAARITRVCLSNTVKRWRTNQRQKRAGKNTHTNHRMRRTESYLLTGIANKDPMKVQQITPATPALLTTISHCARVTTGFSTRVNGEAKAGTALITLNCATGSTGRRGDAQGEF